MARREETEQEAAAPPSTEPEATLGVGMVGYAFMGAAHSQGWRTAGHVFDLPMRPALAAICGRDRTAVTAAAERHGWAAAETDWRALIARDDVQLVDICTPATAMRRSPSPPWRPANTCCARSRSPTRSPRRRP